MTNNKDANILPAYPLVLDDGAQHYLATYLKMYQLFFSVEKAVLIHNTVYGNHFVRITDGKEEATYSWLEFMMYEATDLINNLHTIIDGVYVTHIKTGDFLKTLNFEIFWEQLEDWSEYLTLESFKDGTSPNLEYIFKMFKCTEHWLEKHDQLPKIHKDTLEELMIDVDEYYANNIIDADPDSEEDEKEQEEINPGVIPMTGGMPKVGNEHLSEDNPTEDEPEDEPEVEEEKERSVKASIVTPKMEEHGVFTAD